MIATAIKPDLDTYLQCSVLVYMCIYMFPTANDMFTQTATCVIAAVHSTDKCLYNYMHERPLPPGAHLRESLPPPLLPVVHTAA